MKIEKQCIICNTAFLSQPSAKRKYCSYICSGQATRARRMALTKYVKKTCVICKKITIFKEHNLRYREKKAPVVCCSHKCLGVYNTKK